MYSTLYIFVIIIRRLPGSAGEENETKELKYRRWVGFTPY